MNFAKRPSIFILSYVYVVFITVYGAGSLPLSGIKGEANDKPHPQIENYQTYLWNTNQDIVRMPLSKLSEIGKPKQKSNANSDKTIPSHKAKHVDRVFIVSNPKAELQRIQDANSDVIDAAKAFTGNLALVKQTKESLQKIESALEEPEARILLGGPARPGKTIIAMSLLTSTPNAKMLLMNWCFYDAPKDAFKVRARQDEKEIARLFSPSKKRWMK